MSAILFSGTQRKPWKTFAIMLLWLAFNFLEISGAATENPEKASDFEMTFTGIGPKKTEFFTVEDGWKIWWETESPAFKLSAHGSAQRPYNAPTSKRDNVLRWFEILEPIVLANTTETTGTAVHPLGEPFTSKSWRTDPGALT